MTYGRDGASPLTEDGQEWTLQALHRTWSVRGDTVSKTAVIRTPSPAVVRPAGWQRCVGQGSCPPG
ncbi:predicted protein [Streptomyces viridosporus ATCC 14672]|uniref:Predicted protein n=1 Tax=Streptomyces viridosporus (strain ATCC 14672 / DSM 40746 / JCM 4963 / KCTC 9882 / NRRL B-12104 / FH 1290) TaxID=566461 RepID=D5ZQC5_STRV1|nr:predicted protein [Streptomyces viridosporus ATCC 14672]